MLLESYVRGDMLETVNQWSLYVAERSIGGMLAFKNQGVITELISVTTTLSSQWANLHFPSFPVYDVLMILVSMWWKKGTFP